MARLPRLVVPNQPHHIIQTGNNRQAIFREQDDYKAFLAWLREAAKLFKVAVHAYVLMPDHLHLLVTPSDSTGIGRMMQWVGRQYVPYFNGRYQRTGTLWQGRYRATVIDSDAYFLTCSRYIELNPVRSGIAESPVDYPWSSNAHHVGLRSDPLITDHPLYWDLGNTPFDREVAYRGLMEQELRENEIQALTEATLKGWPLGSDKFKAMLARQAKRRVTPSRRGRPPRQKTIPLSER